MIINVELHLFKKINKGIEVNDCLLPYFYNNNS